MSTPAVPLAMPAPAAAAVRGDAQSRAAATPVTAGRPVAQPQSRAAGAAKSTTPPREAVHAAAQRLEAYLRSVGRELKFQIDEASGRIVVSVLDATTGERIRQIPSEELLRLARAHEDGTESGGFLVNLEI